MSVKLEDLMGEFVTRQRGGTEDIYVCRGCGGENLSVNRMTGLWQCWAGCGSGRVELCELTEPRCSPKEEVESAPLGLFVLAVKAFCKQRDSAEAQEMVRKRIEKEYHLRAPARPVSPHDDSPLMPANMFIFQRDLCMALMDGSERMIGWQSYGSRCSYKIRGKRGVWVWLQPTQGYPTAIIAEGFWDALSLGRMQQGWTTLCLCGNTISEEQLTTITQRIDSRSQVVIAFDNDRLSAAAKAHSLLIPYFREVRVALPPSSQEGCSGMKDWDDIYCRLGLIPGRAVFDEAMESARGGWYD